MEFEKIGRNEADDVEGRIEERKEDVEGSGGMDGLVTIESHLPPNTQSFDLNSSREERKQVAYEELQPTEGLVKKDSKGQTHLNEYKQIKTLGRGSSAKVKLLALEDHRFAAKIFTKSFLSKKKDFIETDSGELILTSALTDFYREIAIMKKLNHQNIIGLKDVIYEDSSDKFYIIMDYCEKGPVMEWDEDLLAFYFPWTSSKIEKKVITEIFRGSISGLYYLHYHNIAHRDIKPQNLLLSDDLTVKLADFGQSHISYDAHMSRRTLGTEQFYPPECCGDSDDFDPKPCDVWALGITFYVILYGKMPFECDSPYQLFETIRNFTLVFPDTQEVEESLKDLIAKMLDKDPNSRIRAFEIVRHPWVSQDACPIQEIKDEPIVVTDLEIKNAIQRVSGIFAAVRFT
jgi:[calcium/calmodulin-dependent protein kinase] kinase